MGAQTIDADGMPPFVRRGSGVRVCGENLLAYDLAVLAVDVEAVVAAAGGWLCDRVRAGWRVTVHTPGPADAGPLIILGVRTADGATAIDLLSRQRPAALAIDARLIAGDDPTRRVMLSAVDSARTEVTVWGETALVAGDRRFSKVSHRLSSAAAAFKDRALASCGTPIPDRRTEEFHSAALWYPPDGTDLAPVHPAGAAG
ncbi:MAG: hypothetical protein SW019_02885 [Actinomycetota bacterium]|nr:hypothetical protein [Actinomycetota bacterium]